MEPIMSKFELICIGAAVICTAVALIAIERGRNR
jgi:hypothetical protein